MLGAVSVTVERKQSSVARLLCFYEKNKVDMTTALALTNHFLYHHGFCDRPIPVTCHFRSACVSQFKLIDTPFCCSTGISYWLITVV